MIRYERSSEHFAKIHAILGLRVSTTSTEMPGGAPRQRKLRNVCTASDYEELREAYRFVPEAPPAAASAGTSAAHTQSADSTASTWQSRMARRYESHLYREFVLADLTHYQSGQVGLRWRTREEVSCGKGFDTCGNKHCSSYGSSGTRDIEAARRASRSRMSEELTRRYYLNAQKRPGETTAVKHSQRGSEDEEMAALSQLSYGCGLADYEVPFSYVEQEEQKSELVKLRLCLRCAPMLFFGRRGALGAKMARERLSSAQTIASTKQQFKEDEEEEDASSDSSRSAPHSTGKHKRRKRRKKKGRKRKKKDKEHREQRRRKKCRHGRRKEKKEDSDSNSDSGADSSDDASINSVDSSIEGRRAEEGLLASVSLAE